MNEFHDEELIRVLQRLGEVQPAPEATERALDRVRRLLVQAPAYKLHVGSRRRSWVKRILVAAALLLVASSASAWLLLRSPASASAGFVHLRNAMKRPESLTYRQTIRVKGESSDLTTRLLILHKGLWCAERSDGSYTLMDIDQGRVLSVFPLNRKAELLQGRVFAQNNLYEAITTLANNSSARALPARKYFATDIIGYTVTVQARNFTVWANAETQLPVAIKAEGKDDQGRACQIMVDQFQFDKQLDPKLFAFEVPDGYNLSTKGVAKLPAAPNDPKLKDLLVTPLVGLGPVKFGMKVAEVEECLGKADEVEEPKADSFVMGYGSRGFSLNVSKSKGVSAISCVAQKAMVTRVRDFNGQTDKGIFLGAAVADVIRAYGEPDKNETRMASNYLVYDKLQTHFTFVDDMLVQIWIGQLPAITKGPQ